jgi:O-antigen/teichoic acid export membrane protein
MPPEVVGIANAALPAERPRPRATLTRRASLNALQSLLDYSAKLGVGLVVVPILVTGLGRSLFGVWEMLGRLVGHMAAADGRPTQALRLLMANRQFDDGVAAKRRQIGSALVVWLICLPLVLAVGALLVWLAPWITGVPPDLQGTVRLACALLVGGLLATTLAAVPESVLRGLNLGYKRMGLQTGVSVVGGLLMAVAVYAGFGLVGLAASQIVVAGLAGVCFWIVTRKVVGWFGVGFPRAAEVRSMLGMSLWLALGDFIAKLLTASDVLVLGALVSTTAVTAYVLTGYAARLAVNLLVLATDAAMPGLAGIIGSRDYARAAALRREMLALTWLFTAVSGTTILLWNRSFLHLWVGPDNYAGGWIDLLIVALAAQTAFIRCDAYVIDAALRPRARVLTAAVAAGVTLALSVALTHRWGMVGLCLGILAGRSTQSICYPILVHRSLEQARTLPVRDLVRPLLAMLLLFATAAFLGRRLSAESWVEWGGCVIVTAGLVTGLAAVMGLPAHSRSSVARRMKVIAGLEGRPAAADGRTG